MRLFIAILFRDEILDELAALQQVLRGQALHGRFTARENLHLTLAFLGEVGADRAGALRGIVSDLRFAPFGLRIGGLGRFRRIGGDILWAGIDGGQPLADIHERLTAALAAAGFETDRRDFTPHLTLARETTLREGFSLSALSARTPALRTEIARISLMRSDRVNGKLTYTDITSGDPPQTDFT